VVATEGEQAERLFTDRPSDRFRPRLAEFFVGDVFEDDPVDALVTGRGARQRAGGDLGDLEAVGLHQFGGCGPVGAGDQDPRRPLDPDRGPERVVLGARVGFARDLDFVAVGALALRRPHAEEEGVVADPELDPLLADRGAVAADLEHGRGGDRAAHRDLERERIAGVEGGRRFEPGDGGVGGRGGESDGVDGDVAFARRRREPERFAFGLLAVAEEDDAAAARGAGEGEFERPLQVAAAPFDAAPGFARQRAGPGAGEFGPAAELDHVALGAAAFVRLQPFALDFGGGDADAERAVEDQRGRRCGRARRRVEEGDRDEDEAGELEAGRDAPAGGRAAVRFAAPGVERLEDEDEERRRQHPAPPVAVAGVHGRGGGREVDRGARRRRGAGLTPTASSRVPHGPSRVTT